MPVDTHHEDYDARAMDWKRVRDAIVGESAVKAAGEHYLPRPPGMAAIGRIEFRDGRQIVDDRYGFYLSFAEFPEIIGPTVDGIQGMIHEKPPDVELPAQLEYLIEDATPDGEDLRTLWERVTREVTSTGRIVLLHDVDLDDQVKFCTYPVEGMINWRLAPKKMGGFPELVVLHDMQDEPKGEDGFESAEVHYYAELRLVDGLYAVRRWKKADRDKLQVIIDETTDEDGWLFPSHFGRNLLSIPIDVINAAGEGFDFGPVPVMPMVRRAFSIYRKTADYNRSLYVKTDPQVVAYGVDDDDMPTEIGGDGIWHFSNPDARVEYLDIDGLGIPLLRQAIEDEYQRFHEEGGRLRENDGGPESGEAVKRRQMVKQVTVKSLVINAASQFEKALRHIAMTAGLGKEAIDAIKFEPNLDFAEPPMPPQEYNQLVDAKLKGAPISWKSIHRQSLLRDLTDMPYEEEMDEIEKEQMDMPALREPRVPIDDEQVVEEPVQEEVAA